MGAVGARVERAIVSCCLIVMIVGRRLVRGAVVVGARLRRQVTEA
jgi:hypothetical protein